MIRRITFRQLQIFCAVTRHQSFVRASEELHLTQPAVSMQVKQLEDVVGLALIDRVGKRVALTEAGRHFHEHAARVLGELHDAEETLNQMKGLRGGTVTVGMVSTAKYFVPKLLSRFTALYPDIELRLMTGNRATLLGYLNRNEIDLAIMGRPPREMQMVAEAFAQHPYIFIAPNGHHLAGVANVDLFDMRDETMLLREPESGTRILNEEYFEKCLFTPKRKIEMGSNETIKQAVMAGMGLALLSQHTLGLELKHRAIAILDIAGTPIMRTWHIAHPSEKRHSPVARAMRDFVLQHGGEFLRAEFAPVGGKPAMPAASIAAERRPRKRARPTALV